MLRPDGSTDGTAEVLQEFGDSIVTVRQPNRGEGAAKNAAVQLATGEYVVVLDADDVFLPRRLEALAWLATRRSDLDILTTDAIVEANGVPIRRAYHSGWSFPRRDQRAAILDRNFIFGLCAVRRERWLAEGGYDENLAYAADWEFWQRLILSGSRVGLVNHPLARYCLSADTLSAHRTALVAARLVVLKRALGLSDLTPSERVVVRTATRREKRELQLRQADASLDRGGWPARAQFARVLFGRPFGVRHRLRALRAMMSPARQLVADEPAARSRSAPASGSPATSLHGDVAGPRCEPPAIQSAQTR